MGDNIKNEFKDFVATLSTEICREVLLNELKDINYSFRQTEKNYKSLYSNYSNNVTTVKNQMIELKNTNENLHKFITSLMQNNNKINDALRVINGEHTKAIEKITRENNEILNEYSKKVQSLNSTERREFINQLTSTIDRTNQKYMLELRNIIDGISMKTIYGNISNDLASLSKNLNLVYFEIQKISELTIDLENKTVKDINKSLQSIQNFSNIRNDEINGKINYLNQQMNNKFLVLNETINKKNNIIIGLIGFIILLCLGMLTL